MERDKQSTYVRGLIIGGLRHDLLWVRTAIRLDLEHNGKVTDALDVIDRFRDSLHLADLTSGEKVRLANRI